MSESDSPDTFEEWLDHPSTTVHRNRDWDPERTNEQPYHFLLLEESDQKFSPALILKMDARNPGQNVEFAQDTLRKTNADLEVSGVISSDVNIEKLYSSYDLRSDEASSDRNALLKKLVESTDFYVEGDDITLKTVEAVASAMEEAGFVGSDASMDIALGEYSTWHPESHEVIQLHADRHNGDEPVFQDDPAFVTRTVSPDEIVDHIKENPREMEYLLDNEPERIIQNIDVETYEESVRSDERDNGVVLVEDFLKGNGDELTDDHVKNLLEDEPQLALTVIEYSGGRLTPTHHRGEYGETGDQIIERCEQRIESDSSPDTDSGESSGVTMR